MRDGFEGFMTASELTYYIDEADKAISVDKQISRRSDHFYSFMWLDTSSLTAFDLSQTFYNYHLESTYSKANTFGAV